MPDDPYVYPGTRTLRNRYGVRDPDELARLEAGLTARRLAVLATRPLPGAYDLAHLQAFHRQIFGDLYDWAGQIRTVTIAKGDVFALPQHIEPYLAEVFAELSAERHLHGLERGPMLDRLSHYLAEINAVHPFRDGNGRTQRAFIAQLAADAGYQINWQHLDPTANIAASQAAHRGDNRPLRGVLDQLTRSADPGRESRDAITDAFPDRPARRPSETRRVMDSAEPRAPRPRRRQR